MAEWYYVVGGERVGPADLQTLAGKLSSGELPGDTLVWKDGMDDWAEADLVPELSMPAGAPPPASGPASVLEQPAVGAAPVGEYDPFAGERYGYASADSYAGFWKRFVAFILDNIIVGAFSCIIGIILGVLMVVAGADPENSTGANVFFNLFGVLAAWMYHALFESSTMQATPGKMALQIIVTDIHGNRLSFARATGRHFGKLLSGLILGFGYIMAGFTEKKQALHDMLASTLVVNR